MPALKIGIQIASLGLPLKRAIPLVAEWGVQAIELDARRGFTPEEASQTVLRQLRKLLSDHRLRVSAVAYPTRRGYDTADDLERRVEGTKQAMKLAAAPGWPVVVNRVGEIPEKPESEITAKPEGAVGVCWCKRCTIWVGTGSALAPIGRGDGGGGAGAAAAADRCVAGGKPGG